MSIKKKNNNMLENIQTATSEELKNELLEVEREFNDAKFIMSDAYNTMKEMKAKYDKIKMELEKRNGGIKK